MTAVDRIAQIARDTGAEQQPALPAREVIAFEYRRDGVALFLAGGECLDASLEGEEASDNGRLLEGLQLLTRRRQIHEGTIYVRRSIATGDGTRSIVFVEAGR